ncbi:hypothetical protein Ahy_Scaffold6g108045 [Arachis hypogaea]|uniref:Transposase MuDR plant domain-containing protein n=1 Tax=Arachis hypogaea TaxID=3818 RepID=A0A444WPT3_ARAHY|nr:hypothetical protein Ahy_Scaffold6g108045 [Arachis hypogaea]
MVGLAGPIRKHKLMQQKMQNMEMKVRKMVKQRSMTVPDLYTMQRTHDQTYNPTHTCGREFGSNMADQHWVARKLEKRLLSQPWLTHAEAWDHMKVDYNVILSDKMLYRGLQMARKKYVGNEKAQYGKLRIPCVHAMAAIAKRGDRPDTYVHKWLKMDAFRATYGHSISPVNSEEYWEKSGEISSIPPKIKRPIGRPTGHNAKTCKGAPKVGTNPKGKVKGKSKEKSTATQEEVQVSQSAPVTELNMCDNMLRIQSEAPTNHTVPDIGMNVNAATPSRHPKQTIIRPKRQESVSVETMVAASSGITSRMFKFIPNAWNEPL